MQLSDEEIIARLTQVRGIGRWTVEMLLIFQLRRPDVLPVDDFGVRSGFRAAYGLARMPQLRRSPLGASAGSRSGRRPRGTCGGAGTEARRHVAGACGAHPPAAPEEAAPRRSSRGGQESGAQEAAAPRKARKQDSARV